jgi:transposase
MEEFVDLKFQVWHNSYLREFAVLKLLNCLQRELERVASSMPDWSPRGQTPVLQYHFNWKTLSAIAGVTWWTFCVRLFPGTVRSPQVVEFLSRLMRHVPGNLLLTWDGLRSHRSRLVPDFMSQTEGRMQIEYLPAYAPELNPVEYLWGHWKHHEIPNLCPKNLGQLSEHCDECDVDRAWSLHSGDKPDCFNVTILGDS